MKILFRFLLLFYYPVAVVFVLVISVIGLIVSAFYWVITGDFERPNDFMEGYLRKILLIK
jgi:hypothetical protein